MATITKSPAIWDEIGNKVITINYTDENGETLSPSPTISVTVVRKLKRIECSGAQEGSWPNPQFYNEAPNIEGLSFTAVYYGENGSDGYTKDITGQVTITYPSGIWPTIGNTHATFSYTESDITQTVDVDAIIYRKLMSISCNSSNKWGMQRENTSVNLSGAVFTAFYNNGTSANIPVSDIIKSRSDWGVGGYQNISFSYTENGVTEEISTGCYMSYTVTAVSSTPQRGSVSGSTYYTYPNGTTFTPSVSPQSGYHIYEWEISGASPSEYNLRGNTITINDEVAKDVTMSGYFTPDAIILDKFQISTTATTITFRN